MSFKIQCCYSPGATEGDNESSGQSAHMEEAKLQTTITYTTFLASYCLEFQWCGYKDSAMDITLGTDFSELTTKMSHFCTHTHLLTTLQWPLLMFISWS